MPLMSSPLADLIFNIGNAALTIGALLVLGGTILAVWAGGVKERYADERITTNEKETQQAKTRASEADEKAANALERAAALEKEAALSKERSLILEKQIDTERTGRIALEKDVSRMQPRDIKPEQQSTLETALLGLNLAGKTIQVTYDMACSDGRQVSAVLMSVFGRIPQVRVRGGMIGAPGIGYLSATGLKILSGDPALASSLSKALTAAGIANEVGSVPPGDDPQIAAQIFVSNQVQ